MYTTEYYTVLTEDDLLDLHMATWMDVKKHSIKMENNKSLWSLEYLIYVDKTQPKNTS